MDAKGFLGSLFDLSFENFITIRIIKWLYVAIIAGVALGSVLFLAASLGTRSVTSVFVALVILPFFFLFWVTLGRGYLEVVIVLFRIAENTGLLVKQGGGTNGEPPPLPTEMT